MRGVERRGQGHTCLAGGRRNRPCLAGAVSTVAQQRVGASAARVCPRRGPPAGVDAVVAGVFPGVYM